jgi:hypothetical protein
MLEPPRSSTVAQITLTAHGDVYAVDSPQTRELARRVQACVNACAGLSTEDLENGLIDQLREVVKQLAPLAARAQQA